ncbi:hypothetical protein ACOSQ2_031324 [Xanthoceras sorbifolium]
MRPNPRWRCSNEDLNIIGHFFVTLSRSRRLGERGERASWGRGVVQRREKSGGRRGGAVGAVGGFTKMKCCSRAPKGKMQVGKKIKKNRLSTTGSFGPVVVCLSTTGHENP